MRKSRLSFARYSLSRRKQRRKQIAIAVSAGLCGLLIVVTVLAKKYGIWSGQWTIWHSFLDQNLTKGELADTKVFSLVSLPATQRAAQLEALTQEPNTPGHSRARYLLAADLIQQQQGKKALSLLNGLESDYPVLAPYIALKRAQAYEATGDQVKASSSWQDVLKRYPDSPVAAEALWALGKMNPKDWEQVIAKFPGHPRVIDIARTWLSENPNQPRWMLLLAKYAFDTPEITSILDRLVRQPETVTTKGLLPLKPEDWEAIALSYWLNRKYGQASDAYAKAPHTPSNAYRVARGLHLAQKRAEADLAYKQMVRDFPHAKETATALLQIAKLEPAIEVVPYLDQVVNQFPDRAGEALLAEAQVLDQIKSTKAAEEARQLLLTKYGNSNAAAEYRWQTAQAKVAEGDIPAASQLAQLISTQNPHSEQARVAGFWIGKWAMRLGQQQSAVTAFQQVLAQYPQSYYAWRSAAMLGLHVGDFTTVGQLSPPVVRPAERPVLPIGSAMLKELYQLGQDQDAWTLWQAEFQNRIKPTVAEQFTDGLLRQAVGDYLAGITQVSQLEDRDEPSDQAQYQSLKQQPIYWQALYPLAFGEVIETKSKQRQLNPLLVTALIRQESRFMPNIHSGAGAIGLMQVMPDIGALVAKRMNLKQYALDDPNDNVHLGTWLLDSTLRQYKNNSLLAVASYNAGSGNVAKWLQKKELTDPDEFVEAIPLTETKDYVKQVFGNYWNYLRLYNPQVGQQVANFSPAQLTTLH